MDRRGRILIVSDSVAMPRPGVSYENTWICRLKAGFRDLDIIDRSSRGSTTFRLVSEGGGGSDLLETYMPGTVILQLGITECAPRLFNKKGLEYFIVSRVLSGKLRERYIRAVKKNRTRDPDLTDVSPEDFYHNLINYFHRAMQISARVLVVPIMRPSNLYMSKSPRIADNISWYNSIIAEAAGRFSNVTIVEVFNEDFDINRVCIDELHINEAGHLMIFNKISPYIAKASAGTGGY